MFYGSSANIADERGEISCWSATFAEARGKVADERANVFSSLANVFSLFANIAKGFGESQSSPSDVAGERGDFAGRF